MRFGGEHPLLFSIHIPKTAGTRFRTILQRVYGPRLALWYAPDNPLTHPLLRIERNGFTSAVHDSLVDAGIRVVHGHFTAAAIAGAVDDPGRICAWLREPISHTISHYYSLKKLPDRTSRLARAADLDLDAFLRLPIAHNLQTRALDGFAVEDYGFLGVSELLTEMLPLVGLTDREATVNANPDKPDLPLGERLRIVPSVTDDLALYSWVLDRALARLGRRAQAVRAPLADRLFRGARALRGLLSPT